MALDTQLLSATRSDAIRAARRRSPGAFKDLDGLVMFLAFVASGVLLVAAAVLISSLDLSGHAALLLLPGYLAGGQMPGWLVGEWLTGRTLSLNGSRPIFGRQVAAHGAIGWAITIAAVIATELRL